MQVMTTQETEIKFSYVKNILKKSPTLIIGEYTELKPDIDLRKSIKSKKKFLQKTIDF